MRNIRISIFCTIPPFPLYMPPTAFHIAPNLLTFTLMICFCSGTRLNPSVFYTWYQCSTPEWQPLTHLTGAMGALYQSHGLQWQPASAWGKIEVQCWRKTWGEMQTKTIVRHQPNFTKTVPIREPRRGPLWCQAQWREFDPRNSHGGMKELIPPNWFLNCSHLPWLAGLPIPK